ncbi:uncharacterized protein C2845_PM04G26680 [Panicum miliaceum]|uniref:Bromo domain-containing protein n=1 Tax=Panicum miliaceum TaxID=4540 RepID=A0A3L6QV62_PANMI|nr:uncharacterized protein C2845_PM04G26680 [Panicum miliaceum]
MVVVAVGGGGGGGGGWGTWEELVLGGAVLRHGGAAWAAVADELRTRSPCFFSPEECEAKFAEIQLRYSACNAWFEELRKQRVAELKRELEKSENSIGSLQSVIQSLSNSKHGDGSSECRTSHTESCSHSENTADTSSGKEASRDRSSAASFTEEASNSQKAQQVQQCDTDSVQANNPSPDGSYPQDQVEKRKRVRYKKMIRRHMDFRTLHSKIKNGAISSTKELLRDILIFVNNVIAFYPKATLEHMAAVELRDLSCKIVKQGASLLLKIRGETGTAGASAVKKNARAQQLGRPGPGDARGGKVSSREATAKEGDGKSSRNDASLAANQKTTQRNEPAKKRGVDQGIWTRRTASTCLSEQLFLLVISVS